MIDPKKRIVRKIKAIKKVKREAVAEAVAVAKITEVARVITRTVRDHFWMIRDKCLPTINLNLRKFTHQTSYSRFRHTISLCIVTIRCFDKHRMRQATRSAANFPRAAKS